eukprot:49233-Eustigmatos_ZCMA.PRE.1
MLKKRKAERLEQRATDPLLINETDAAAIVAKNNACIAERSLQEAYDRAGKKGKAVILYCTLAMVQLATGRRKNEILFKNVQLSDIPNRLHWDLAKRECDGHFPLLYDGNPQD